MPISHFFWGFFVSFVVSFLIEGALCAGDLVMFLCFWEFAFDKSTLVLIIYDF